MGQRVVGGGECFVKAVSVPLNGVAVLDIIVPPGADLARVQAQLWTNAGYTLLVKREDAPTLASNEIALDSRDVLSDAFPAGTHIHGLLVDGTGTQANGGLLDSVQVVFYTNAAGRAGRKVS